MAMNSQDRLKNILREYRRGISEILGDELDTVVLYGSQARAEATDESDIDVLCIMRGPFDYGEVILRTAAVSAAISLHYDVVISTAFVTRSDYETRNTPFLMYVVRRCPYE